MGCPDDYTVQAIMRWGYPSPQDPRIDDLLGDIADLKASIASTNSEITSLMIAQKALAEKRSGYLDELLEKESALESLGHYA